MTIKAASQLTGISARKIRKLIKEGAVTGYEVHQGKRIVAAVNPSELQDVISAPDPHRKVPDVEESNGPDDNNSPDSLVHQQGVNADNKTNLQEWVVTGAAVLGATLGVVNLYFGSQQRTEDSQVQERLAEADADKFLDAAWDALGGSLHSVDIGSKPASLRQLEASKRNILQAKK